MDERYLLSIISDITKKKGDAKIYPTYAIREEIMERIGADMRQCLQEMMRNRQINYHKLLNSWAVETI